MWFENISIDTVSGDYVKNNSCIVPMPPLYIIISLVKSQLANVYFVCINNWINPVPEVTGILFILSRKNVRKGRHNDKPNDVTIHLLSFVKFTQRFTLDLNISNSGKNKNQHFPDEIGVIFLFLGNKKGDVFSITISFKIRAIMPERLTDLLKQNAYGIINVMKPLMFIYYYIYLIILCVGLRM